MNSEEYNKLNEKEKQKNRKDKKDKQDEKDGTDGNLLAKGEATVLSKKKSASKKT